jgi:hypothetical protein
VTPTLLGSGFLMGQAGALAFLSLLQAAALRGAHGAGLAV